MAIISPWGYHLVLDLSKCNHRRITSYDMIHDFAKILVDTLDMVSYGEPQIVKFGSGNKEGYTLVQLIETSNITAHFVDETDTAYLDIFSCKHYNPDIVIDVVRTFFQPQKIKSTFLIRNADIDNEQVLSG